MDKLRKTPLEQFHIENNAKMVPFAGWNMPVQYSSILQEHSAVRNTAGLFDVSHMGEVLVIGKEAKDFLNYISTNDIKKLYKGKALYSFLCNPHGGVIDDIIIYQTDENSYFICVNASNIEKDFKWIVNNITNFDCQAINISAQYGQIAIQGPQATKIIAKEIPETKEIKRFHFLETQYLEYEIMISRTGYTGEDGFEIYCQADHTEKITQQIYKNGQEEGLTLCGLGCRDSLRLEAGLPLYGHEIDECISPIQAGFSWATKSNNEQFIGKTALDEEKAKSPDHKIIHFTLNNKRIAREGTEILHEGNKAGLVKSGSLSPILNKAIGSALINTEFLNKELYVDLRGNKIPVEIQKTPLHKNI